MRRIAVIVFLMLLLWGMTARAGGLRIVLEGVDGALRENVLSTLSLARYAAETETPDPFRIRRLYRRADREIRKALEPFGYYRVRIDSELKRGEDGGWLARFRIAPGEPVRLESVTIRILGEGRSAPALREAIAGFPLGPGAPARHDRYEAGKKALLQAAREAGYRDARFTIHRLEIDPERNIARIRLVLDTGPRYRFGEVRFSGTRLDPSLLAAMVPFRPGEPYSPDRLLALQRALERSGYFSVVDVVPVVSGAQEYRIPVEVRLVPAKPNRYLLGLGYGTDTGYRFRLGWQRRYLGSRGHRFDLDLGLSGIRQEARFSYRIPLSRPLTDVLQITAGLGDRSTGSNDAVVRVLGVRRHQVRGRREQSFGIRAESTTFRVGADSGTSRLLVPDFEVRRVRREDDRAGSRIALTLDGAAEALFSDVSFIRLQLEGKRIVPLGERARLLLRAKVGTLAASDFSRLPPAYRFFAGGDQSVRGYAFESLGPRDASGRIAGGRQLVEGSIEFQRRIRRELGLAVFLDIGNAVDRLGDPLRRGAGIGLRWRLPVGMAGIDLAFALGEPGTPWRIHLTLGPEL